MRRLSGQETKALCELIKVHFDMQTLDMALAFEFGFSRRLEHYSTDGNFEAATFRLVDAFDKNGELEQLACALSRGNAAASLKEGLDNLLSAVGPAKKSGADPSEALMLSTRPFVAVLNRIELRRHLRNFGSPTGDWACALSITGVAACGKTHSWRLACHVAQHLRAETFYLDFVPPYGARDLHEAINRIVLGMRLPHASLQTEILRDSPTPEKLAEKFASWLAGHSKTLPNQWWLCIDSLNLAEAQPVREFLVPRLLREAAHRNLGQIRLVLIGYDARSVRDARGVALHENARQLDRTDFLNFFEACAVAKGIALTPQELEDMASDVLQEQIPPYDHATMDMIFDRLPEVVTAVLT